MRIAVVGTGISGSLVARLLSARHEVTVFEADDSPGGHAKTVDVELEGRTRAVDLGFMVFNRRTYPEFCRLLELLEVPSRPSDMSFSVRCARSGLEYQGSSFDGLFAQRINLLRPRFVGMLADIVRFNRIGQQSLADGTLQDGRTVREFLRENRLGAYFTEYYLLPMAAAIWSTRPPAILDFPAEFLIRFFANHGLMQIHDRPQWRTIVGGSRRYVTALLRPIRDRVRCRCRVVSVQRHNGHVSVGTENGERQEFDQVVFASHADQSLAMLADPSPMEQRVLRAFPYQRNDAVLHTDTRLLPRRRRTWASWNYHRTSGEQSAVSVTYDLNRLQGLQLRQPLLLTLNATAAIDPGRVVQTCRFEHPAFSAESLTAQRKFSEISGQRRTHFCGAYWGYGFHEDGVRSALAVARHFALDLDACTAVSTKARFATADMSL